MRRLCKILLVLWTFVGFAQDDGVYTPLALINAYTPLETAGAHGAGGLQLGVGLGVIPIHTSDDALLEELQLEENDTSLSMQRLWVTKGLFYPLDLGLSVAQHKASGISSAGGYLQYTLYEDFAMPACALRTSVSKLFGSEQYVLQSQSIETILSWGIWYASLFGTLGVTRNTFSDSIEQQTQADQKTRSLGVYLQILPPFMIAAFEMRQEDIHRTYNAKISVGL